MDDGLRSRLATSLSGTYSLERELGGGGMSRVFVAEETALGRRVVVKVLSPELAEALSGERFIREIRVAARLQQANIVPVLRAGELDGLPYYTMPFVAGESLRAALATGRLATPKALAILRDVAKALAYAHNEGVVHRDIKPENVLLSAGTAVVTDFGIAKAISESRTTNERNATALTALGVSLGTPAYMAPEQAAGDPSTDARADIYAWGVMAYELLAGKHPFAQYRSTHELIRAHMTETPEHLSVRTTDVPLAVSDLVMRCLAKSADDRPKHAGELLEVLDAATSGANTVATRAPIGLGRALAIYAAAFMLIALVAKLSITLIGLPEWVLPGAVGVMVLGLPMVLLTGFIPQRFTWRRTTIGGAIVAGAFVVVVGGYMAMRSLGIGPFGSLIGSKALAARDRIIVADMRGPASDTALGGVFAEGMRVGLSESNAMRLVSMDQVNRILQQMQRPGASVTGDVARDVATRAGAKAVLDGDVHRVGSAAILTVRLMPTSGGDPLVTLQETARDDADFSAATGRLAKKLRARVGESLKRVNTAVPLEQVTTASLPALRRYTAGVRAGLSGDYITSMRSLREAIALDSTFAGAYSLLGVMMQQISGTRHFQTEMLQHAYDLRHKLPKAEQLRVEMNYWTAGPNPDLGKAIVAGELALEQYSDAAPAVRRLSDLYYRTQRFPDALEAARQAIAIDSSFVESFYDLARSHAALGQLDSARAAIERFAGIAPRHPLVFMLRYAMALEEGQDSVAWAIARGMEGFKSEPLAVEIGAYLHFAVAQRAGKLRQAIASLMTARQVALQRGSRMHVYSGFTDQAYHDVYFRGDSARAVRLLDSLLKVVPMESLPPRDRNYSSFTYVYMHAGRPDRIRELVRAQERDDPKAFDELQVPILPLQRGVLARVEGRPADALRHFREASRVGASRWVAPRIALAHLDLGQKDSAVVYFERFLNSSTIDLDGFIEAAWLAEVRQRLAELYEERGEVDKAHALYAALVEQWRYADPELQPQVRKFRDRMRQLDRRRG
jgi:tRNA A-37 threonylcarbamoyl transferase component Bud32/tetratricopeptide (TPR) repeat protein